MSQVPLEEIHHPDEVTATGRPSLPQSAQDQSSQGESNFIDGSGPLFTMFTEMAGEEDKKMAESWKGDADGILIFTGLFSAAVAALTAVSIQDLRPNSQDDSAFYLANIYQLLADPNGFNASAPLAPPPSHGFSPRKYAIWVNALWFLSLAISITCAMLATLLQQWARRYIKITQPRYNPHKRARIRAFFAEGVDHLHLPATVEALPALLHLSVFLFFAGLLIYLFNINQTVFSAVVWWLVLCTAVYACITLMPIFRHDSPYYAPLSSSAWYIYNGTSCVLFQVLRWFSLKIYGHRATRNRFRFGDLEKHYRKWFLQGVGKTVEETARTSLGIDYRSLMWTFDSLDEDHELERFFAGVPGLCSSRVVHDPMGGFIEPNMTKLSVALTGLLDRTMTSNLVTDPVKQRRSIICMKAMDAVSVTLDRWIFDRLFIGEWDGLLGSVEFGLFVMKARYGNPLSAYYSQSMVSIIIARVQERDHRWFKLVTGQLGISEIVLQSYLAHGDSVLLDNLIYICRLTMDSYRAHGWTRRTDSRSKTFESVSKLDVQRTLPALQHLFCSLWNEIVLEARNGDGGESLVYSLPLLILRHIRSIYITLHHGTFAAPTAFSSSTTDDDRILYQTSSYPLCNVESHCAVPLNTIPYNPRVITLVTEHSVRSSTAGQWLRVPPTTPPSLSTTMSIANSNSSRTRLRPPMPPDSIPWPIPEFQNQGFAVLDSSDMASTEVPGLRDSEGTRTFAADHSRRRRSTLALAADTHEMPPWDSDSPEIQADLPVVSDTSSEAHRG